jgi:uncharacterized membrane protein HdeD (DUF308 family)
VADILDPVGTLPGTMRSHWAWFLIEGIVLIVLGALAIIVPLIAGLAVTIILGWLLVAAGIVGLFATSNARRAPGFAWAMVSAILALIAGVVLLWNPAAGLVTLTLVLMAYFIIDGVTNIALGIAHRREVSSRWEWLLFNGVVDLALAVIIIIGLPGAVTWILGLLVGVDLVIGGTALIAMALAARRVLS